MIDSLETKTKQVKAIGERLNTRVKDYTLLRLTFEFQKQKSHLAIMPPALFDETGSSSRMDQTYMANSRNMMIEPESSTSPKNAYYEE